MQSPANCDLLHLGGRSYLHADFDVKRANSDVIAHPPVVVWPDVAATSGVPADVSERLIDVISGVDST